MCGKERGKSGKLVMTCEMSPRKNPEYQFKDNKDRNLLYCLLSFRHSQTRILLSTFLIDRVEIRTETKKLFVFNQKCFSKVFHTKKTKRHVHTHQLLLLLLRVAEVGISIFFHETFFVMRVCCHLYLCV